MFFSAFCLASAGLREGVGSVGREGGDEMGGDDAVERS